MTGCSGHQLISSFQFCLLIVSHLYFWLVESRIKRWPSKTWADSLQPFCVLRKGQDGRIVEVESHASPVSSIEPDFIPSSWAPELLVHIYSHTWLAAAVRCAMITGLRVRNQTHDLTHSQSQYNTVLSSPQWSIDHISIWPDIAGKNSLCHMASVTFQKLNFLLWQILV